MLTGRLRIFGYSWQFLEHLMQPPTGSLLCLPTIAVKHWSFRLGPTAVSSQTRLYECSSISALKCCAVYSRVYNTAVPVFGFGPVVGVATQVHERNIKHRTVSCWRKEAAKYGKVEQARRCLEATVLVRLHHRYWSAWVDLLRQRQKLCRAIFTTTKVTASAARAIIADAFYVLRRAGIVGASYSER